MRGLELEKGFGTPFGLALGPTDKVRPLNTMDRKSGPYILHINVKLSIARFIAIAWKPLLDLFKAVCIMIELMHGDRKNVN